MSDRVVVRFWLGSDGRYVEMAVTLDEAARLERGEPIARRGGLAERWSRRRLQAAKELALARQEQILAAMGELLAREAERWLAAAADSDRPEEDDPDAAL